MYLRYVYHGKLVILIFVIHIVEGSLIHENVQSYKSDHNSMPFQLSGVLNHKHEIKPRAVTTTVHTIVNSTDTKPVTLKKWQVGRVSRKQYEIINMLWRKRKEFNDVETSTYYLGHIRFTKSSHLHPISTLSTPSYIEFYYLDSIDQISKKRRSQQTSKSDELTRTANVGPVFTMRINDLNYSQRFSPKREAYLNTETSDKSQVFSLPHPAVIKKLVNVDSLNSTMLNKICSRYFNKTDTQNNLKYPDSSNPMLGFYTKKQNNIDDETCALTTDSTATFKTETKKRRPNLNTHQAEELSTTASDRIKFFEIYDKNTPLPEYYDGHFLYFDYVKEPIKANTLDKFNGSQNPNNNEKILLEHVDHGISSKLTRSKQKKHITNKNNNAFENFSLSDNKSELGNFSEIGTTWDPVTFNITTQKNISKTRYQLMELLTSNLKEGNFRTNTSSKVAVWRDYSYMASYIYEPSQVHCDAAGVTPHWLVTAASCLSRHQMIPGGEGPSAFVTYCGDAWWKFERITYVRLSVVHPRYHKRDQRRKYMYNIGLVQVVTSMSTCFNWEPVPIMSHRFIADPEGSTAHAIGWGLDRYDVQYSSADLPKHPLMIYESQIFSNSCPGNIGYMKAMKTAKADGIKNVYCLSLPPYSGEESDPIHGSMLLVGEKLCALYIQEERHPSGQQCAQYTGIWHLGQWILDTAHEPDDSESFEV